MKIENIVYFSALLHDIGKFLWRIRSSTSYNHSQLGSKFVLGLREGEKVIVAPFPSHILSNKEREILAQVIGHHHEKNMREIKGDEPAYSIAKIVSFADKISASEREEDNFSGKRLYSVFSEISIERNDSISCEGTISCFPFEKLSLESPVFPFEGCDRFDEEKYEKLVMDFLREYNQLVSLKLDFETSLLYLLQKYLWAVPSAYYYSKPDISLFEHLKTTAAIALALFKEAGLNGDLSFERPYWLLIMGDISGIQNFIYTISSKGAAKGLKGRSFYIELLQRAASRYILQVLGLKEANIIYMGGGKVYILAYASAEERLEEIEKNINKFLFEKFGGDLYFALAAERMTAKDFRRQEEENESNISAVFGKAFSKLEEKKSKKFSPILVEKYEKFFEPTPEIMKHQICAVCGKELTEEEIEAHRREEERKGEGFPLKCKTCKDMERLGGAIKNTSWLVEAEGPTEESFHPERFNFGGYVLDYILFGGEKVPNYNHSIAFRINNTDFVEPNLFKNSNGGIGFLFIGGNKTFEDDTNAGKTFEHLVKGNEGGKEGPKKLGVFRADVDYLGKIFSKGLGKNYSLARLSQLSFLLKYFFSGIVNTIFRDSIIIYSGGDDLFVVGRWDKLLNEVSELQEKFREFVKNPCITLSGGYIYVPPKFPIYTFSEMAGEEEEKAKSSGKNRFSGFGVTPCWEDFFILKSIKDELLEAVEGGLAKSYLQYLMRISGLSEKEEKLRHSEKTSSVEKSIKLYRWKWHLVYQHARLKKRYEKNEKLTSLFKKIEKFLKSGEWDGKRLREPDKATKFIYLPARWAELETRKGGEE